MRAAFATLLTREAYLPGTLVLLRSWEAVGSKYEFVVMVTPDLSQRARNLLQQNKVTVREIQRLKPLEGVHTLATHDQRFADTWTKLRVFELAEYDRIAFLDSDILILQTMDSLLEYDLPGHDWIAACHVCTCNPRKLPHYPADWVPENCAYTPLATKDDSIPLTVSVTPEAKRTYGLLNGGVVLLQPSVRLASQLYDFLYTSPLVSTFSFPDQDLLAHFFRGRWKPLPYVYNALKTLRIIHSPLWRDEHVKCVHYILHDKPWMQPRGTGGQYEVLNEWWWSRYDDLAEKLRETDLEGYELLEVQVTKTMS